MNPETTLTNNQIITIFQKHGLTTDDISRITIGFTNEIHEVDGHILKVCIKEENEPQFKKETFLYEALKDKVAVPELVAVDTSKTLIDKFYMIYRKIEGEPLASHWHELTNEQRKKLIKRFCEQLKRIATFDREKYAEVCHVEPSLDWQQHQLTELRKWQSVVSERQLFSSEKLKTIDEFIERHQHVLKPQQLAVTYWDVHFDNVLVGQNMNFAGLIDFESVDIVSIDYLLATVRRMVQESHRYLTLEMEPFARKADYEHLMEWYEEFYPELFDFPELERRLDLYDLADILRLRVYFPNESEERLDRIISTHSAGGIILNTHNEVLLVDEGDGFWGFPKGRTEGSETTLDTALREVKEETGLTNVVKIKELGIYQRHPVIDGVEDRSELKNITLFLFRTSEELPSQNLENNQCAWFAIEQVADKLSHVRDREFFEQATRSLL